jgi:hypothetical protein
MQRASALLVVGLALAVAASAGEQDEAKAFLERAIKAAGGADKLSRFPAVVFKVSGTDHAEGKATRFKSEWYVQGQTQVRIVSTSAEDGKPVQTVRVVNGDKGWIKEGDGPAEPMDKDDLHYEKESLYVNWVTALVPLRERPFRLELLGESKVDGHAAVGLRVVAPRHRPLKLFFDKQTYLLLELERRTAAPGEDKEVTEVMRFKGYKDVQGTQQPTHIEIRWDGKTVSEADVTDMTLHEKLDAKLFAKP